MKLFDLLLKTYIEEYDLNLKEGLIKTTNMHKAISILQKKFDFGFEYIKEANAFAVVFHNIPEYKLKDFINYANNLGWFPSYMKTDNYKGKWNVKAYNTIITKVFFEAKFDEELVDKIPEVLYHITPSINTDKILKIGLSPKSRSKVAYHPERVYLGISEDSVQKLSHRMYQITGSRKWTILKINTDLIPGGYFRLYKDSNYANKGFYTQNNIPPTAIEKIKDIEL
jgi:hypothetical protein